MNICSYPEFRYLTSKERICLAVSYVNLFVHSWGNLSCNCMSTGKMWSLIWQFCNKAYFWSAFVVLYNILGNFLVIYNESIPSRMRKHYKEHILGSKLFIHFWVQTLRYLKINIYKSQSYDVERKRIVELNLKYDTNIRVQNKQVNITQCLWMYSDIAKVQSHAREQNPPNMDCVDLHIYLGQEWNDSKWVT